MIKSKLDAYIDMRNAVTQRETATEIRERTYREMTLADYERRAEEKQRRHEEKMASIRAGYSRAVSPRDDEHIESIERAKEEWRWFTISPPVPRYAVSSCDPDPFATELARRSALDAKLELAMRAMEEKARRDRFLGLAEAADRYAVTETVASGHHTHTLSWDISKTTVEVGPRPKAVLVQPMSNGACPEVGMLVVHEGTTFEIERIEIETPSWRPIAIGHAVSEEGMFSAGRLYIRAPLSELEPAPVKAEEKAA